MLRAMIRRFARLVEKMVDGEEEYVILNKMDLEDEDSAEDGEEHSSTKTWGLGEEALNRFSTTKQKQR